MRAMWRRMWAATYDLTLAGSERTWLGDLRRRALGPAAGRVLEIGAGTGANFGRYPAGVTVIATEPDAAMLARAPRRPGVLGVRASAGALPVATAGLDTVTSTLVLCTVPDPAAALAEVRRVLRPGGRYLFLEHGGAPAGTRRGAWQHRIEPFWRPLAGGCHLTRDAPALVQAAGFTLEHHERVEPPVPAFLRPFTLGVAIR